MRGQWSCRDGYPRVSLRALPFAAPAALGFFSTSVAFGGSTLPRYPRVSLRALPFAAPVAFGFFSASAAFGGSTLPRYPRVSLRALPFAAPVAFGGPQLSGEKDAKPQAALGRLSRTRERGTIGSWLSSRYPRQRRWNVSWRPPRWPRYGEDWLTPGAGSRYADTRDPGRFRNWQAEQALVGRWLRSCPAGSRVLDLPCGTGRFSGLVAECGHRLIRADLSLEMVVQARQLGPNHHVLGDMCCDLAVPPFSAGSMDAVLVWRLFHHLRSPADRQMVLDRARQLSRGLVIISFYNRENLTYWCRKLIRGALRRPPKCRGAIWTRELREAADRAGLDLVELRHFRPGISLNSAACFRVR